VVVAAVVMLPTLVKLVVRVVVPHITVVAEHQEHLVKVILAVQLVVIQVLMVQAVAVVEQVVLVQMLLVLAATATVVLVELQLTLTQTQLGYRQQFPLHLMQSV
jgi:hypothetical protein